MKYFDYDENNDCFYIKSKKIEVIEVGAVMGTVEMKPGTKVLKF